MTFDFFMYFTILIFIAIAAFFSAIETAFSTVSEIKLKNYARNGNKQAIDALYITQHFDQALSTILVGNTIINIASSSIATFLAIELLGSSGALVSTIAMTVLILVFGEILPKSFAKENSEKISLLVSKFLLFFMKLTYPIIFIFVKIRKITSGKLYDESNEPSFTEQELKYIVENIEKEGVIEEQESDLVQSALEFDEKTAQDILTPRVDMIAIDINYSKQRVNEIVLKERFSRIPVYENSIDNIIGILHTRDYLESIILETNINLKDMLQPVSFAYKTKKISYLLTEFKHQKLHIAIIYDEYGGTLGIVTMEDLLEQLVGDIWDEDEEIKNNFIKIEDGKYEVNGNVSFGEILDFFEIDDQNDEDEFILLSGLAMEVFGRIPEPGETFSYKGFNFIIKKVFGQRIIELILEKEE